MGRKRNKVIAGEFSKQLDFVGLLDCVSLSTKPIYVAQEDGHWPPYAEVIATRIWARDPRIRDEQSSLKRALMTGDFRPMIYDAQPFKKWCSHCGEWIDRLDFAENKAMHDGLQKWCKSCANRHRRRMYYLAQEAKRHAA